MIRLHNVWTWGRWTARKCRGCGCDPDHPCTIVLAGRAGTGVCVPAGALGLRRCSGCTT